MAKMNFTPIDEMCDEIWGKVGTPKGDAMEAHFTVNIKAGAHSL